MNGPRIGVGVVITRGDEILLMRRSGRHGPGTWSTPGGHLEPGESLEECCAREALEETGIEVGDVRFRAITNDVFENGRHYVTVWMEGEYVAGEVPAGATQEASAVGWFPWTDLPAPLFLPFRNLVEGRCYPVP